MLDLEDLNNRKRQVRDLKTHPEDLIVRVHRTISWLKRSEDAISDDEIDIALICLWISFNAAYGNGGIDRDTLSWKDFFGRIHRADAASSILYSLKAIEPSPLKALVDDYSLYADFWRNCKTNNSSISGDEELSWKISFEDEKNKVWESVRSNNFVHFMHVLFSRIYVCRNQIFHGSSTYASSANRLQIQRCVLVLSATMPVIVDLMLKKPDDFSHDLTVPVLGDTQQLGKSFQ